MSWQPMATRPRRPRMTARDYVDCALVVLVVILIAHLVARCVPLPT